MDINEYISSGILELYVAGALDASEMQEVDTMASRYPEVRNEIEAIERTVQNMLRMKGINPRPELRARVLDAVASSAPARASEPSGASQPPPNVYPMPSPAPSATRPWMRYMLAASIALTILSSAAALHFRNRLLDTEQQLASATDRQQQIVQEQKTLKARLDDASHDMAILREGENRVVHLVGQKVSPNALAMVVWNPRSHHVFMDPGTLPQAPDGKQYQLWAIGKSGPVDLGMITGTDASGLHEMKQTDEAIAFAVTLEPAGGSPAPTMDAMYVMGKVVG